MAAHRIRKWIALPALLAAGCGGAEITVGGNNDWAGVGRPPDLTGVAPSGDAPFVAPTDDSGQSRSDGGNGGQPTACGDPDPSCTKKSFGPMAGVPFPLQSDPKPDPNESDNGVNRDANGYLGLDTSHGSFDFLWLANSNDWGSGTVSKVNSKQVREVARYMSVTCYSNKTGSKAACDGTNGCCAIDDWDDFNWRMGHAGQSSGKHQPVLIGSQGVNSANSPSRTAVDFNGDVWVSNRAFGDQSSITKIANDLSGCIDRNGNGKIDSSSDVNGDGQIATDCNANGVMDDLDDVKKKPCANGMPQEFFGLDDECILFTTNTNVKKQYGRPLALGRGSVDFAPSDAWAGTYQDGKFFRIDGVTGQTKAQAQLPSGHNPYGAAIDASGILWAPDLGQGLTYFDTGNPAQSYVVRQPKVGGQTGYGVTLDRDQNVWTAGWNTGHAHRYTPDRSAGTAKLGNGFWTAFQNPGGNAGASGSGRGIAADSRTQNGYFIWMARDGGFIVRVDASLTPAPQGMDIVVNSAAMPAVQVAGSSTIGAGVDRDQNIWGISYTGSVATHITVDMNGNMSKPNITGQPAAGARCPAGDACPLRDNQTSDPNPYTYSDFTGFGLRNFTLPRGSYSYIFKGCVMAKTKWMRIVYMADQPPGTKLTVKARTGMTPMPDATWGAWSMDNASSPVELWKSMLVMPNAADASSYMQVEFDFSTTDKTASPKLQGFDVLFECIAGIG